MQTYKHKQIHNTHSINSNQSRIIKSESANHTPRRYTKIHAVFISAKINLDRFLSLMICYYEMSSNFSCTFFIAIAIAFSMHEMNGSNRFAEMGNDLISNGWFIQNTPIDQFVLKQLHR